MFGEDRSENELWERCTDWLRAEGGFEPNNYLQLPLTYLRWLLENGVIPPDKLPANERLAALDAVRRELENWKRFNSPSETGSIDKGNLDKRHLHATIVDLQPFYGGDLPKPALGIWRTFLNLDLIDPKAEKNIVEQRLKQFERFLEWVKGEIQTSSDPSAAEGNACTPGGQLGSDETRSRPKRRGRKKANGETVKQEAKLAADWVSARDAGTYKSDFAKEAGMTQKSFDTLLDRVAKRKSRSDN
ncbi:hypothetical protein [Symmachiella macrocystis]|nr:hypothetical protein [Symmachiella macrocystis]